VDNRLATAGVVGLSPLYRRVEDRILKDLAAGQWRSGEPIPAETKLAKRFDVSIGTVRKAIDELVARQILVRHQGRGTFVAVHDEDRALFYFFRVVARDGIKKYPTSELLSFSEGRADPAQAAALRIPRGAPILRFRNRLAIEGRALILDRIAVPQSLFPGLDEATLRAVEDVILDEVNVKRLETASGDSGVVVKSAKPNFKALGRKLGKQMKDANAAIRALDSADVAAYEASGTLELALPSGPVTLEAGDLEVVSEGVEGRIVRQETATDAGGIVRTVTVALDTTLDDALRAEGFQREFVNRVQGLRKDAGFDVSDRIAIEFAAPEAVGPFILAGEGLSELFAGPVRAETLSGSLALADAPTGEHVADVEIGGATLTVAVRRL